MSGLGGRAAIVGAGATEFSKEAGRSETRLGAASVVVAYRAVKARSGRRFGAARAGIAASSSHSGTTAGQWAAPFGVLTPASWMSLNATRYMHRFGVANEDFGRAVVQLRAYAAANPAARFYGRPVTLADHQASRWIAEPAIRLFGCCQETDGSVAFVIMSTERAAATRAPVTIAAAGSAALLGQEIATDHYSADLSVMEGSVALARQLFGGGDIKRSDVDVALIYDAFSPILFMQLEGLGLLRPWRGQGLRRRRQPGPVRGAAVQHQRRADRRGVHPRPQPDARGGQAAAG